MDIFPIEWRNEGLVQTRQDRMRHIVSDSFDPAYFAHLDFDFTIVREQFYEGPRTGNQVRGHVGKHVKKTRIFRDQAKHKCQNESGLRAALPRVLAERANISCWTR